MQLLSQDMLRSLLLLFSPQPEGSMACGLWNKPMRTQNMSQ
jgi:hypothetical protein